MGWATTCKDYYYEVDGDYPCERIQADNDCHAMFLATSYATLAQQRLLVVYEEMDDGYLRIIFDIGWYT